MRLEVWCAVLVLGGCVAPGPVGPGSPGDALFGGGAGCDFRCPDAACEAARREVVASVAAQLEGAERVAIGEARVEVRWQPGGGPAVASSSNERFLPSKPLAGWPGLSATGLMNDVVAAARGAVSPYRLVGRATSLRVASPTAFMATTELAPTAPGGLFHARARRRVRFWLKLLVDETHAWVMVAKGRDETAYVFRRRLAPGARAVVTLAVGQGREASALLSPLPVRPGNLEPSFAQEVAARLGLSAAPATLAALSVRFQSRYAGATSKGGGRLGWVLVAAGAVALVALWVTNPPAGLLAWLGGAALAAKSKMVATALLLGTMALQTASQAAEPSRLAACSAPRDPGSAAFRAWAEAGYASLALTSHLYRPENAPQMRQRAAELWVRLSHQNHPAFRRRHRAELAPERLAQVVQAVVARALRLDEPVTSLETIDPLADALAPVDLRALSRDARCEGCGSLVELGRSPDVAHALATQVAFHRLRELGVIPSPAGDAGSPTHEARVGLWLDGAAEPSAVVVARGRSEVEAVEVADRVVDVLLGLGFYAEARYPEMPVTPRGALGEVPPVELEVPSAAADLRLALSTTAVKGSPAKPKVRVKRPSKRQQRRNRWRPEMNSRPRPLSTALEGQRFCWLAKCDFETHRRFRAGPSFPAKVQAEVRSDNKEDAIKRCLMAFPEDSYGSRRVVSTVQVPVSNSEDCPRPRCFEAMFEYRPDLAPYMNVICRGRSVHSMHDAMRYAIAACKPGGGYPHGEFPRLNSFESSVTDRCDEGGKVMNFP